MAQILLEFESVILGKPREVFVYIPKKLMKYPSLNLTLNKVDKTNPPVIYLLHGKSGKGSSFYYHTDVIKLCEKYGIITIAPNMDNSYYTNMAYGEKYFDYLAQEVPFMIKETFNFSCSRENTYLLGYSMGGYGAMKLGLTYPERFKGIASLSGSLRSVEENRKLISTMQRDDLLLCYGDKSSPHDGDNDLYNLVERAINEGKELPEIYLYCGQNDSLITYNLRFKEFLEKKQIAHDFIKDEGSHDFRYWNKQIECYFKQINEKRGVK